jgi:membrane protease YdiL (CAAX protease family)
LSQQDSRQSAIDLLWVLGAMLPTIWLLRPVSIVFAGPAGLLLAVIVGTWRLRVRGLRWNSVGLASPETALKLAEAIVIVFVLAIVLGGAAGLVPGLLPLEQAPPDVDHLAGLQGNAPYFLFRLGLAWATSIAEELIFRGLAISWLDRALGGTRASLVLAIALQACLFGYLHFATQGIAGAFSAGGRGFALGIGYAAFKRNLWPLIAVHVALNTIAFAELFGSA